MFQINTHFSNTFVGMKRLVYFVGIIFFLANCTEPEKKLPFLGEPEFVGNDTIYPTIKDFSFIDQDCTLVTNQTFDKKIYVTDFIFLSCPTICPVMTNEMSKVYQVFKSTPKIMFLSHTIDPERDTIEALKNYTKALGINSQKWHFVTGDKKTIHSMAEDNYYSVAYPDSTATGGFVHGSGFLLIDENRHIRGVYDGTNPKETKRLISDIKVLLKEQSQ